MIRSIFSVLLIIFSSTTSDKPALIVNSSDPSDPSAMTKTFSANIGVDQHISTGELYE